MDLSTVNQCGSMTLESLIESSRADHRSSNMTAKFQPNTLKQSILKKPTVTTKSALENTVPKFTPKSIRNKSAEYLKAYRNRAQNQEASVL